MFVLIKNYRAMTEESKKCLKETKENMNNSLMHLEREFQKIRAGKANPSMLDDVMVDYYGNPTPLNQVGNVNTPDAKLIVVQPWEKNMIGPIEKAILAANLGFNPQNDGTIIRIPVPPLTEERRMQLVKQAKAEAEQAKIAIRNIRKTANDTAKQLEKDGIPEDEKKQLENQIQDLTKEFTDKIEKLFELKEKDIMTV